MNIFSNHTAGNVVLKQCVHDVENASHEGDKCAPNGEEEDSGKISNYENILNYVNSIGIACKDKEQTKIQEIFSKSERIISAVDYISYAEDFIFIFNSLDKNTQDLVIKKLKKEVEGSTANYINLEPLDSILLEKINYLTSNGLLAKEDMENAIIKGLKKTAILETITNKRKPSFEDLKGIVKKEIDDLKGLIFKDHKTKTKQELVCEENKDILTVEEFDILRTTVHYDKSINKPEDLIKATFNILLTGVSWIEDKDQGHISNIQTEQFDFKREDENISTKETEIVGIGNFEGDQESSELESSIYGGICPIVTLNYGTLDYIEPNLLENLMMS